LPVKPAFAEKVRTALSPTLKPLVGTGEFAWAHASSCKEHPVAPIENLVLGVTLTPVNVIPAPGSTPKSVSTPPLFDEV
jgi:hypothetical protein